MKQAKDHLTEQERELLAIFRELDEREQRRVLLAAEAVRATREQRERLRW